MTKPVEDSLLREIDEDLRRERYALLWKRYGWVIITLVVVLVVSVAGYEAWRGYQQRAYMRSGEQFAKAVALAEADPATAASEFRELAEDGPGGYPILARLREAAVYLEQNDPAAAGPVYDALASRADDPLYSDLAVILKVMADMQSDVTPANAAEIRRRLSPLTAPDRPWQYTAREISAHLALRSGEAEQARELLTALSTDVQAPEGIRARATSMLAEIGRA